MNDNYRDTYEVMSVSKWIGTILILGIPILNIIMYVIWAFSSNTNPNLSNFCKATLLVGIIGFFIALTLASCSSLLFML